MPPSPPMSTDASFDSSSPRSKPSGHFSAISGSASYYHETTPPLDGDGQHFRHQRVPKTGPHASSAPGFSQQQYQTASYSSQPSSSAYREAAPPSHPKSQPPGIMYQKGLPQSFPPPLSLPPTIPPAPTSAGTNPWQHHHYLNPTCSGFPQNQDRYVCQTCNKAFSRPSSLRIHSHSHTGEKPFKCPHAGCGKAFSVRSNMKRHERGCHSFEVSAGGPTMS